MFLKINNLKDIIWTMRKNISTFFRSLQSSYFVVSKETWERQYQRKDWDFLRDICELPRYSLIAGYIRFFKPAGLILDVGCGEGVLQERLRPEDYSKLIGIDISEVAIRNAQAKAKHHMAYICSPLENYNCREKFDVIIFNEVLYYLRAPETIVQKYQEMLNPGGIFITEEVQI